VCLKELVTLGSSSNRPGFSELPNVDRRICFDGSGRFSEQEDRQHFQSSSANNPIRSNSAADLSTQSSTINLSSNASSLNNVNNIKVSFS
jgi:hypothetical protein